MKYSWSLLNSRKFYLTNQLIKSEIKISKNELLRTDKSRNYIFIFNKINSSVIFDSSREKPCKNSGVSF